MDHLHKVQQDNHYPAHFFQQDKPQQKTNKKPNPSTGKFIEGARANRSLKESISDHRNQTTSAIRNHHISTKHPKVELKDFTIIDKQQHPTPSSKRSMSHSYQKSITQQKYCQSQNPFSIQQTSQTSQTTRTST